MHDADMRFILRVHYEASERDCIVHRLHGSVVSGRADVMSTQGVLQVRTSCKRIHS